MSGLSVRTAAGLGWDDPKERALRPELDMQRVLARGDPGAVAASRRHFHDGEVELNLGGGGRRQQRGEAEQLGEGWGWRRDHL